MNLNPAVQTAKYAEYAKEEGTKPTKTFSRWVKRSPSAARVDFVWVAVPTAVLRFITGFRVERMKSGKSGGGLLAPAFGVRSVSPALSLRGTGCRGARVGMSRRKESGASSTRTPNAGATSDPPLRCEVSALSEFREAPFFRVNRRPLLAAIAVFFLAPAVFGADLRIGLIGLDTSHVIAFTKLLNDPADPNHVPGGKVVAGFKGGSPDIESSRSRVEGYTQQLQTDLGVAIVDSIEALCGQVDAVMLESVDGRPHLEQARPVIRAGKRLFIDKPVAGSLRDAVEIYRLAREKNVPVFSSSSYRYYDSLVQVKKTDVGEIRSVISYGPAHLEPHHPDLFWYGVHPTEALFTILGTGCETVARTTTADTDVVTGLWAGGRVGTLHALRKGPTPPKVIVFGTKAVAEQQGSGDYAPLIREVIRFFQTGVAPVSPEETLELFAFMEAADESKRLGGQPVKVREVLTRHGEPLSPR
jgi:hypothetical protein